MVFDGILVVGGKPRIIERWRQKMNGAQENSVCVICGKETAGIGKHRFTCSSVCHEKLVSQLEKDCGEFKEITDGVTGLTHRVPLRHIIEKGLHYNELKDFPVVE